MQAFWATQPNERSRYETRLAISCSSTCLQLVVEPQLPSCSQAEKVQDKAKAKKDKEPAADIAKYLRAAGLMETRYVRMVANLCAQTYYMEKLTVRINSLRVPFCIDVWLDHSPNAILVENPAS